MKITRKQLKRIIKEELNRITENPDSSWDVHQTWEEKFKEFTKKVNEVAEALARAYNRKSSRPSPAHAWLEILPHQGVAEWDALDQDTKDRVNFFRSVNRMLFDRNISKIEDLSIEAFVPNEDVETEIEELLSLIPERSSFNTLRPIINELLRLGAQFKKLFDSEQ